MKKYCIGRTLIIGLSLVIANGAFGIDPKPEAVQPSSSDGMYATAKPNAAAVKAQSQANARRRQIMAAVRAGDTAQLTQLLKSAQPSEISDALRWAVVFKEVNMARLILNSGYNASQDTNRNHILNLAINNNDTEMVRLLVNKGLAANIEGMRGRDALENARRKGNQAIVDILVKAKGLK